MYFVYLKTSRKSDEIRAQIFQEMPKADCAVLPYPIAPRALKETPLTSMWKKMLHQMELVRS